MLVLLTLLSRRNKCVHDTQTVGPVSAKVTPAPDSRAADVRRWCVPTPAADEMVLQENIDFVCGQGGIDCAAIRPGGICFEPDTVQAHAAYAMDLYFQSNGQHVFDCDFGQTGVVTTVDPSKIFFSLFWSRLIYVLIFDKLKYLRVEFFSWQVTKAANLHEVRADRNKASFLSFFWGGSKCMHELVPVN